MKQSYKILTPIIVSIIIAFIPAPNELPQHAWYFFAIFFGVVVGLILEPFEGAIIGLIGICVTTIFAPYVLYSPEQIANGLNTTENSVSWALSGFSNSTIWLIFAAFMFSLGYQKTGLGKRIALILVKLMGKNTLTLGYAIILADLILSPAMPSSTARSGGIIFPVINHLPSLYNSKPNDSSARKIGSYIMWVALASVSITSSLFFTALAPNLLSASLIEKSVNIKLEWMQWLKISAPAALLSLSLIPIVTYFVYPPEIKSNQEVPKWASEQIKSLGFLTKKEILLIIFVFISLILWIFAETYINGTIVGVLMFTAMVLSGIISWDDVLSNKAAWNTLIWFSTLVSLASALSSTGFIKWFGDSVAYSLNDIPPTIATILLLIIFYLLHYMFASTTTHATALVPVMIAAASSIKGINLEVFSYLLTISLGYMGILTPYGSGSSPVYYGSGYIPSKDFWKLGAVFGFLFLAIFLFIQVPWAFLIL